MEEKLIKYLQEEPLARERKHHKRAVVNLLLRYSRFQNIKDFDKDMLVAFCSEFENGTRAWRHVTKNNEALRGKDYDEKDHLEQQKQKELGY